MENRKRKIQLKFRVDEKEEKIIRKKMKQVGYTNFASFARRMLIGGLVVNPSIPEFDDALIKMSRIGNNINQAVRRINSSEVPNKEDIKILKQGVYEIWLSLKSIESTLR